MIFTFCGHSDYISNSEDEAKIFDIFDKIIDNQPVEFFLGGYGKFDGFAYSCAKKYKATHHNARLIYVTPYLDRKSDVEYDNIVYPALENVPKRFAISRRNRWMAERADVLICYVVRKYGGAYQTYTHAKRKGKTIFNLFDGLT